MEGLPASQQQTITAKLREHVSVYMTKIPLMKMAIAEAGKKNPALIELDQYVEGMTALMFTDMDPFKIYKKVKESKSPAAAKAGQKAPRDIVVKAGATSFSPGPIIGEFASVGIKAGIDAGKVAIKADSVVAKEGQPISALLASILLRLDIKPMEIGLNIRAIYDNGIVYTRKVLDVDEDELLARVALAVVQASTLTLDLGIITKENIDILLGRAARSARALALDAGIVNDDTVGALLAKASAEADALSALEKQNS